MSFIMTIDGGTTNTRVRLINNKKILAKSSISFGAKNMAISRNKKKLIKQLNGIINDILAKAKINSSQLDLVIASGMITSNIGILEVPHVEAPADTEKIAKGCRFVKMPDLIDVPVLFIPGIKNSVNFNADDFKFESMDIMRGEETETIGILKLKKLKGPLSMILTGSHTKILKVDEKNQITGCFTTMTGEIFSMLALKTILADAIPKSLVTYLEMEEVLKGVKLSQTVGLTRACFCTRILSQFGSNDGNKKANFLLGVVLGQDIIAIKNSDSYSLSKDEPIVISGPYHLRQAFFNLLKSDPSVKGDLMVLDEETVEMSTVIGAREIAEKYFEMLAKDKDSDAISNE